MGPKPRTRKMIGMISVILAAIAVILAGYLAVGFAGYVAYPHTVSSNVLKTFPGNPLMQACASPHALSPALDPVQHTPIYLQGSVQCGVPRSGCRYSC